MSEDVSSQVRTGVTIILVAALVAAILNLLVVAQSILNSGMSTLQSGVNQITQQEYNTYNQTKITGTEVRSALALYQGRDIAIVIRTNACKDASLGANSWGYVYGSLLDDAVLDTANTSGTLYKLTDALDKSAGDAFYTAEYLYLNGVIQSSHDTTGVMTTGDTEFVLPGARFRSELIKNSTGTIVGICFTQID